MRSRARWLPLLTAAVAAGIGLVNIASALTPRMAWHRHLLLRVEPLERFPLFHALALPASAGLLVAAFYLKRRRVRAWQAAFLLLVALGILAALRGVELEVTLLTWAGVALLWWGRDAFHVRHDPLTLRSALWQAPALVLAAILLCALAVWSFTPTGTSLALVARETGDLLLLDRGPLRFYDEAGFVPLAVGLIALTTLLGAAYLLFRPLAASRQLPDAAARRAAADLVRAHGRDTLSFFKLRRDTLYFFSSSRRAFVGHTIENKVLLVSGDPVGPSEALPELVRELCTFADARGLRVGVVNASRESLPLWQRAGLHAFSIGDEAIVDTASFSLAGRPIRKVRQSVTRLERAGFTAELHDFDELDEAAVTGLESVSAAWRRGAAERGFSMAMDSLRCDRPGSVVVIARDKRGVARGFLHFVPVYGRRALSLSFMRREHDTPNGLTEFLVAKAIELLRERGVDELSLNFAFMARLQHSPRNGLERVLARLVALGNPFFQIESLYRFNAKFFPHWEPRYLVYEGPMGLVRTGLAALWAEGQLPKPRVPRFAR
jgi:lysyl-tRNA synthetase class 2